MSKGAVPLLPVHPDSEKEPPLSPFRRSGVKGTIGADPTGDVTGGLEGMVVSILLPTKSGLSRGPITNDGSAPANFTTLDQIFVVVLKPHSQYATYSCSLPSPILV